MAYWIEIDDPRDRQVYLVDLDRVSAFSLSYNHRLTLYLQSGEAKTLVLTSQSAPEAYRQVLDYIEKTTGHTLDRDRHA